MGWIRKKVRCDTAETQKLVFKLDRAQDYSGFFVRVVVFLMGNKMVMSCRSPVSRFDLNANLISVQPELLVFHTMPWSHNYNTRNFPANNYKTFQCADGL